MKSCLTALALTLLIASCRETPNKPSEPLPITLTAESVGASSVQLRLTIPDTKTPRTFALYRNDQRLMVDTLAGQDTLLVDNTLEPTQAYRYAAYRTDGTAFLDSSQAVSINTPDYAAGRRDYVWTVDTLIASPSDIIYLWSLWGSAANDVWAVGTADAPHIVWHFDGVRWKSDSLRIPVDPYSVYGFGRNEVWFSGGGGGSYGKAPFRKFNGTKWQEFSSTDVLGGSVYMSDIWGDAPNNIYAAGVFFRHIDGAPFGVLMRYNGTEWRIINALDTQGYLQKVRRGFREGSKYYVAGGNIAGDSSTVYEYDGQTFKRIYSGKLLAIDDVDGKLYFIVVDKKVYRYLNNQLQLWQDFNGTDFKARLFGRHEKDMFGFNWNGVGHYNGTNWITIFPTNATLYDISVFEKDVFALARVGYRSIVIHGKLPN